MSIKSAAAERWMRDAVIQIPGNYRGLKLGGKDQLLRAIITIWYPDWRQDLDCAAIYDALQLAGVISNDRWVREHHEYALMDAKNPRCEIILEDTL